MIDELQPQAVIFSDGGPGCRWVGNENGFAGATNWSFLRAGEVYPGYPKYRELQYGHADGNQWVAAECDVSIRPGWFYHPEEDDKVKTVDQLTDFIIKLSCRPQRFDSSDRFIECCFISSESSERIGR